MFNVTFYSYCGMSIPLAEKVSSSDAMAILVQRIARAKRVGQPYSRLERGRWEFETPEDAGSISDSDGILRISPFKRKVNR